VLVLGTAVALSAIASAANADRPVTFTKDVAPILQQKCQDCHQPGSIAPMSLRTYDETRPWARSIKDRVMRRQMPPWHIDKTVGIQKFKNHRSLNDDQIETILQWIAAGAPKGDPNDMPPPKQWADESGWQLANKYGEPNLVVKSPEYTMPPVAQDAWWRPTVPTGLTEPRWVRAIEIRPVGKNARKITHHALARLQQPEDMPAELFTNDPNVAGAGLFMEWAVGKNGDEMRADSGRLMLPNSKIVWEMHYHAVGEEITAHTELAVVLSESDNTKNNKSNPDPDQWVGWGDRTVDGMGHAWLNITYYNDEDFKAQTASRAAKTVNTSVDRQQQ